MNSKHNLALITFGVILFIVASIGIITSVWIFLDEIDDDYNDQELLASFLIASSSIILGYYVRATNFGVQKSDLQNTIDEKEKLKVLLEISELKRKLNNHQ